MPKLGIDPELVIKVARERALDDCPMKALQMLGETFEGMDIRQASDILAGRSTLRPDGEGSFDLVPSAPAEALSYASELEQRYGSRVRIGGKWYEAYAVVTRMGGRDELTWYGIPQSQREMAYRAWRGEARGPGLRPAGDTTDQERRLSCRPLHYAENPYVDRIHYVDTGEDCASLFGMARCPDRAAVLFRPTQEPPPWASPARDPQAAFDNGVASGAVTPVGHVCHHDHGDEPHMANPEPNASETSDSPAPVKARAMNPDHAELRERILSQARDGAGFLTLDWGDGPVEVARAPFERWALRIPGSARESHLHLAPAWDNVCPEDMKMSGDSRDHSDWMIGAGLDPGAMYIDVLLPKPERERAKRIRDVAETAAAEIQRIRLGRKHAVLSGAGMVTGPVWIGVPGETPPPGSIVVVRSASPDWLPAVIAATAEGGGGLVVERGGALAHLVSELRSRAVAILRWPEALSELKNGQPLQLDLDNGLAEVLPHKLDLKVPGGFRSKGRLGR